ncbi:MAG: CNNM domain-containing protein [Pirellulaceae bacterium]
MVIPVAIAPWLAAMAVLIVCSAFFSASEAALFYLRAQDRRVLASGNRSQRMAARLLEDPDRLLTAVLFWNLVANISYFAIVSVAGFQLGRDESHGQSAAVAFGATSLLLIIFFSEMLPKSLAVLSARRLSGWLGTPLSIAVRVADPLMPVFRLANVLSQRLVWPRFHPEPYLEVSDLERAIELSSSNKQLVKQEQAALRNIVLLSDIRVDEWMRPRAQFRTFRPPVSLSDLGGKMTPSGYLLVTEPDSEEVASSVHLKELSDIPQEHLEHHAEPVVYLPWCATVADALQEMKQRHRQVVAVLNEHGETIGILTFEDVLDTVFTYNPSRSRILLNLKPIHYIAPGVWMVAGVTSLRRLASDLKIGFPPSKSVTIAGVIQEKLGRLAEAGDTCDWGPFRMKVLEAPERGHMLVELTRPHGQEEEPG